MQTDPSKTPRMTASDLVVALFTDRMSASDAVADLQLAGFDANRIGIALSAEGKRREESPSAKQDRPIASGEHSFIWRLRHSFEHDLHAHGYAMDSEADAKQSHKHEALYSELDLKDTLLGLGVAEDRIDLLNREIGPKGMLMLVDAGDHCNQVQSILERNCGLIRTDMATEHPRSSTAKSYQA